MFLTAGTLPGSASSAILETRSHFKTDFQGGKPDPSRPVWSFETASTLFRPFDPLRLADQTGLAVIPGDKTDQRGRGVGPQLEIAPFGRDKAGIGHQRMRIVAFRLPWLPRAAGDCQRLARSVPVNIVVDGPVAVFPRTAQQLSVVVIDDVAFEDERVVRFLARTNDLWSMREGEDIIAYKNVSISLHH